MIYNWYYNDLLLVLFRICISLSMIDYSISLHVYQYDLAFVLVVG